MKRRTFITNAMALSLMAMSIPSVVFAELKKETFIPAKSMNALSFETAFKEIVGDAKVMSSDKIKMMLPLLAENGLVVPIEINVDYSSEKDTYIKSIYLLSTKNSNSRLISSDFIAKNTHAYLKTRIKLATSQEVVVLVSLSDGTFIKNKQFVKIIIGGC